MKKLYMLTMSLLILIPAHGAFAQDTNSEKQDTLVERFQQEPPTPDEELQIAITAENNRTLARVLLDLKAMRDAELARQAEEQTRVAVKQGSSGQRHTSEYFSKSPTGNHDPCAEPINGLLPSYIVERESSGQCGAYNHGGCGGRGCLGWAQIDEGHFSANSPWGSGPGSCYGLSYNDCVKKLSNGGTNLAPWKCC